MLAVRCWTWDVACLPPQIKKAPAGFPRGAWVEKTGLLLFRTFRRHRGRNRGGRRCAGSHRWNGGRGRSGLRHGQLLGLFIDQLLDVRTAAFRTGLALDEADQQRDAEEGDGRIPGHLRQHRAGPGAEQRIRRAAAESHARARILLRKLNEHEKDQRDADQHHREHQKTDNKRHNLLDLIEPS